MKHRACVFTPRCRPHHQAARSHHAATSFSRCLSHEMAPEKRKVPHSLPGRSLPAPAAGEEKNSTSLASSPTSR